MIGRDNEDYIMYRDDFGNPHIIDMASKDTTHDKTLGRMLFQIWDKLSDINSLLILTCIIVFFTLCECSCILYTLHKAGINIWRF